DILTNVAFTPDGHWLVSGNARRFQFWQVGSWRLGREIRRAPGAGLLGAMAFSADGRQAALGYSQTTFDVIDLLSGAAHARLECPTDNILTTAAAFSQDNAYLATGT